ncbi:MAG: aminotransferase class I/II-fold pyridoxal phosphate-dependent enzyme [Flavobacterium sp.]|nr:MAG: aminotransferase class I/II-fold pyridoxal phosphate-dependent enzyme [Flavobacterium sp.]
MQEKYNNLKSPLANKITAKGDEYLYFGGTAYLGIPQNEKFLQLYLKGLSHFGLNNGTSRSNNVQLSIYNEVEQYAANKFGAVAALITSSGYLAAQLTVKNLTSFGEVRYAPATHPALWYQNTPKVSGSFTNWATNIVDEINNSEKENWVIISNSMNNLFPEIYDFSFIKLLNKKVLLIIDDSHGIGINNQGLGAFKTIPPCANVEVLVIASMAKALGVDAGIILGTTERINQLKLSHEFLGASPPAAAGLFAFMQAEKIYQNELEKLNQGMESVNQALLKNDDWHFIDNFPVYLSKNAELSHQLAAKNILVSSFPYPDKDGPKINRIVLSSWHTKTDIAYLIKAL